MSEKIHTMFSEISGKYDLLNNSLSFGLHHSWRKKLITKANIQTNQTVLDCATGTGDLARELKTAVGSGGNVVATDFCDPMLDVLRTKDYANQLEIEQADVMNLRFADNTFDATTISFGIRNVDIPQRGIAEMARVVKPGGKVIVLEFGTPDKPFYYFYRFYSKHIIPTIGKLLSGSDYAYSYLHESASKFPFGNEFKEIMNSTDYFKEIKFLKLTFGVVYLYIGIKK